MANDAPGDIEDEESYWSVKLHYNRVHAILVASTVGQTESAVAYAVSRSRLGERGHQEHNQPISRQPI